MLQQVARAFFFSQFFPSSSLNRVCIPPFSPRCFASFLWLLRLDVTEEKWLVPEGILRICRIAPGTEETVSRANQYLLGKQCEMGQLHSCFLFFTSNVSRYLFSAFSAPFCPDEGCINLRDITQRALANWQSQKTYLLQRNPCSRSTIYWNNYFQKRLEKT